MASERETRKRDEILDRALLLFFEKGISSLSMEGIAAAVGVSKATLYKYFPKKELLGMAAIERRIGLLAQRLDQINAVPGISFPERLHGFFEAINEIIRPAIPVFMRDITKDAPWLWPQIEKMRAEEIFPRLAQLIRDGRELGFIREDMDAVAAATMLIAIAERVAQPEFLLSLPVPPGEALQLVIGVLLGGILSERGRQLFNAVQVPAPGPREES
ncbi:MAG TPA: TetR/AcrR family transcriptional regulator [Rectinemataceae bacterium]|nr:TetR/AcrR family transcriptional regulator [Rectinemataceae bacterium]